MQGLGLRVHLGFGGLGLKDEGPCEGGTIGNAPPSRRS